MNEFVVGVTDYLLTLECVVFAVMLLRTTGGQTRLFFVLFFLALALTSLTGGTYHLWFANSTSLPAAALWKTTVVSLGAVAFAAWALGACLLFARPARGRVIAAAAIEFLAYSIYVVAIDDRFLVAISNYIPAVVFLGIGFAMDYRRRRERPALIGLIGLLVTGFAAAVQRSGFSLHPYYFNHNATYHLVQGISLFLIFLAALFLVRNPFPGGIRS